MNVVRLGAKNQITIPAEISEKLGLKPGDFIAIAVEDKKTLRLFPVPRDQAWYWTEEWQQMEREADEDIAAGRVSGPFESAEEVIAWLHRAPHP